VWYVGEGYRGISLPKELVDDVEKFVEGSGRYKSIAQFVSEAIRLRLERVAKKE